MSCPPSPHHALLRLNLVRGLGPVLIQRGIDAFGSVEGFLGASADDLAQLEGVGRAKAGKIRRSIDTDATDDAVAAELEQVERLGVTLVALGETGYPRLLSHIQDPPPLLYVRGRIEQEDALGIAIVGSRRCSAYGREQAGRFAGYAATAGLCTVSGGARGIDAAAHHAALRAGGRTIAVLGSGLAEPYPRDNIELFERIVDQDRGAVVSELPMTAAPRAEHFPRRNRIVSGMSLGVLVIEAASRSGALITARLAAEDHGREVMALPGRVDAATSAGCHRAIRQGWAALVTGGAEMLEALGEAGQMLRAQMPGEAQDNRRPSAADAGLTATQQAILDALAEPRALEQIAAATGEVVHSLQADLTMLEIRGQVRRRGGVFERAG